MAAEPLVLRAHSVLCLQGFRGAGYSPAFVERMSAVHRALAAEPCLLVRLVAAPDHLCAACPHLHGGCTLGGAEHEAHMQAQDLEVLRRLGLAAGTVLPWQEVLGRVASTVQGSDLPAICTTCPWLSLGWCAAGLDRLRTSGGA